MVKISAERATVLHDTASNSHCSCLIHRSGVSHCELFSVSAKFCWVPFRHQLGRTPSACIARIFYGRLFLVGKEILHDPKSLNGRKSYRRPPQTPSMPCCMFSLVSHKVDSVYLQPCLTMTSRMRLWSVFQEWSKPPSPRSTIVFLSSIVCGDRPSLDSLPLDRTVAPFVLIG